LCYAPAPALLQLRSALQAAKDAAEAAQAQAVEAHKAEQDVRVSACTALWALRAVQWACNSICKGKARSGQLLYLKRQGPPGSIQRMPVFASLSFQTQNASLLERLRQAQADAKAAAASSGGAAPPAASPAAPVPDAATSASAPAQPEPEGVPYTVVVHTSDVSGGAFDGKVWVTLYGQGYNSSGEILLPSNRYR
jgi:hypothetical protein